MLKIYVIHERDGQKHWRTCGVAFQNRDGSINLKLDLFPDLSLQVREDAEHQDDTREQTPQRGRSNQRGGRRP